MPQKKDTYTGSDDAHLSTPATEAVIDAEVQPGVESFPIVAIGASAGGLDAFGSLLSALPADTGMAFVVISHLNPTHASALPEILGRATSMPVTEAVDDQAVAPNHVYVMPPGKDMTIDRGRLQLQPRAAQALHRPVDLFFRSLADDRRHLAIGVVLSGTASDGTLGTRAIKGGSGITFAQDASAQQAGMPESAVADGFVDFVLPPAEIARELVRISQLPRAIAASTPTFAEESEYLEQVLERVQRDTGVDFTHYKAPTLRRRILRRMILQKKDRLQDYSQLLHDVPTEARALHDDLLIGVTRFFRDPESFDALTQKAFPALLDGKHAAEPIRVWVLGCSTGEEAYSLAIALTEFLDTARIRVPIQIFASDVNPAGIDIARAGVYPSDIAQDVTPQRLERFFVQLDGQYRIIKSIRDACVFSRHNVLVDPPFSRINLVSCRNLLMYLEPILQRDVVRNLHYALTADGVLWLGSADSIGTQQELFQTHDIQHKIFRRRAGSVSHPTLRRGQSRWQAPVPHAGREDAVRAVDVLKESDRVLLSRFAPPGVLVSPSLEILQYRGEVAPYISPAAGKPSLNLMQVLDRRLQVAVRAAIARSESEAGIVREERVRLTSDRGDERTVSVQVFRIGAGPQGFLILFGEEPATGALSARVGSKELGAPTGKESEQLARVSNELADTQAYLQSLLEDRQASQEDLESAHEEAQSANEELQSINEELETSKEEIQSANEELTTLNEELQHRNTDLLRSNSDLVNVMASTHLSVVFVGLDRSIRSFTAAAATLLRLRPADVGRPLRDLRLNNIIDLDAPVTRTIETLEMSEQNVQNEDGRWLSVRIRPYRTVDNQIDGAVVVFVDIDALIRGRLYAESIIATVRSPLVVLDERFVVVTANEAFYAMFHTVESDTTGCAFFEIGHRAFDVPELRGLLQRLLSENRAVVDFVVTASPESQQPEVTLVNATRLANTDEGRPLLLLSMEDVTERQHADALRRQRVMDLAAADQSKNEFLAMLAHELRNPLAPIRTAAQLLGAADVPSRVLENARIIIERQVQNMTRLIDDLLNVARITQGKIDLRLAPLDLVAVVRRAAEVVQPQLDERTQQLLVTLPPGPLYVLGDATRLEQALGNVLTNASKFTNRAGRIWISVESKPTPHGDDVFVYIRDEGIGIDAQTLPRIFELFKQGGSSPHRASGLGIGLALVRRIVELHGGRVLVRSAGTGHGSEFEIGLPLLHDTDDAVEEPGASAPPAVVSSEQRVLVVDDNIDAAESLRALLRVWGHQVEMVHDGPAALEVAPRFLPSLVFLDIGMPGMDGYEVARRLRRIPELERTRLIAVTGFGSKQDRIRAEHAGFDLHVTKPADPAVLRTLIADCAKASTDES